MTGNETCASSSALPSIRWLADMRRSTTSKISWLWQGYLAPKNMTLLTSQWKTGKTTLLSILLHQMKSGGQLAGLPVASGKAIVISEECEELWLERADKFDYADHVCWFCRPFLGKPTPQQWHNLVGHILTLHEQIGLDLLVIDPLALFLPGRDENNAAVMVEFLAPLQQLAVAGLAVLLWHHPRKKSQVPGTAARGSGALTGFADILMEMRYFADPASDDRRRELFGWSRYAATRHQLVIELDPAGTSYSALGSLEDATLAELHPTLLHLLNQASGKLTAKQILEAWPPDQRKPDTDVYRWLNRGLRDGLFLRDRDGTKDRPHRYWLPAREQQWLKDPIYRIFDEDEKNVERALAQLEGHTFFPALPQDTD